MTSSHSVTVRRVFQAQPARVFAAFSSAEALGKWFTPDPDISIEILAFDFAPQGAFRFCFTMPGDERKGVGGRYERIAPHDEIVFSWIWEAPDPHAAIPTQVRIQFLEQDGGTEVVLTHAQLPSDEVGERHALGWKGMFARLAAGFANPQSLATDAQKDAAHV